eukprot:PhM_4_TR765/c0_g1_i1/m.35381/K01279/TPP1, CLN2; tripeptidyl-peptidase I
MTKTTTSVILLVLTFVVAMAYASHHHHHFAGGELKALLGHDARPVPSNWAHINTEVIDTAESFRVTVALRRRNMHLVNERFAAASDPKHALYGEHYTPSELGSIIAPSAEDVDMVTRWLRASKVASFRMSANLDMAQFDATAAHIEQMFSVRFATYEHKETRRRVTRALGAVSVPEALHQIVELVAGFRAFPIDHRPVKSRLMSGSDNDITPAVIIQAYNITTFPAAQKDNVQAFFQAQGQYVETSDLSSFCDKYFSGTKCAVTKYIGQNTPSEPGVESSLDSEYIMGVSKGQQETWVFSYPNFDFCADLIQWGTDVMNMKNDTHRPRVISMSYGSQALPNMCAGADVPRLSEDIKLMGSIGVTVIIASGDSGSGQYSRMGSNNGKLNPSFPASIPYCVAVGSTKFISGNSGPEKASDQFGSGGGFSFDFNQTEASYQKDAIDAYFKSGVNMPDSGMYERNGRGTPDVSAFGEGFEVLSGGSWEQVGGTSASTPTFAGMVSLLNNERMKVGKSLGFLNPLLYQHADAFRDVTVGTNAISPNTIGWQCAKGWDPATGLGSPNFEALLKVVQNLNARDLAKKQH